MESRKYKELPFSKEFDPNALRLVTEKAVRPTLHTADRESLISLSTHLCCVGAWWFGAVSSSRRWPPRVLRVKRSLIPSPVPLLITLGSCGPSSLLLDCPFPLLFLDRVTHAIFPSQQKSHRFFLIFVKLFLFLKIIL